MQRGTERYVFPNTLLHCLLVTYCICRNYWNTYSVIFLAGFHVLEINHMWEVQNVLDVMTTTRPHHMSVKKKKKKHLPRPSW